MKKIENAIAAINDTIAVSIPSRGFWFFEVDGTRLAPSLGRIMFQSPRGDFGFLKLFLIRHALVSFTPICFNPLAGILVF